MAGRRPHAALGALVAVVVAVGLLLMHGGIDPTHTGGHGSVADTAAALPGTGDPLDGAPSDAHGGHGGHDDLLPLAGICAVFAVVAVAVALRWRPPGGPVVVHTPERRASRITFVPLVLEPPPRLALCVERC